MSFRLRGPGALLAAVSFSVLGAGVAGAGPLDERLAELAVPAEAPLSLDAPVEADAATTALSHRLDEVPTGDLGPVADFHPETDRWTDRNNRIRITLWSGGWAFGNELDIHHDVVVGIRLNWEVPGFIGIRFDVGAVPWPARMEVKAATGVNPQSSRQMAGVVSNWNLSLGIFNPELSVPGLAFWAGFGGGLWVYTFDEDDIFGDGSGVDGSFDDINIGGNIFVELDYKVADILHVGLGTRLHVILADHTDDGRFYELNGVDQSFGSGRNDGIVDDLALVGELTLNISVLF